MDIKVVNAGNCMICGSEIKIIATRGNNKFPNIFFCPQCEKRIERENANPSQKVR